MHTHTSIHPYTHPYIDTCIHIHIYFFYRGERSSDFQETWHYINLNHEIQFPLKDFPRCNVSNFLTHDCKIMQLIREGEEKKLEVKCTVSNV